MTTSGRDDLAGLIITMLGERGVEKTICPSEVARAIAGSDETKWRLLMKPIRDVAVEMARQGRVSIRRKGRIVDPDDFKGVYRLGAGEAGGAPSRVAVEDAPPEDGDGKNASVLPVSR